MENFSFLTFSIFLPHLPAAPEENHKAENDHPNSRQGLHQKRQNSSDIYHKAHLINRI